MDKRICAYCGKEFSALEHGRKKYCSEQCSWHATRVREWARRNGMDNEDPETLAKYKAFKATQYSANMVNNVKERKTAPAAVRKIGLGAGVRKCHSCGKETAGNYWCPECTAKRRKTYGFAEGDDDVFS